MEKYLVIVCLYYLSSFLSPQDHNQPHEKIKHLKGQYHFNNATIISWNESGMGAALFFRDSLVNEKILAKPHFNGADIFLVTDTKLNLGNGGFILEILASQIIITANNETGFKNSISKLFFLCFGEDKPMDRKLNSIRLDCMELTCTDKEAELNQN